MDSPLKKFQAKRITLKKAVLLPALIAVLSGIIGISILCKYNKSPEFYCFYATGFRGPFFTGFLTMGSFLFSVKSFSLLRLLSDVYNSEHYQQTYAKAMKDSSSTIHVESYMYPIKNLGDLLFWSITISLMASILQISVGLIPSGYSAIFCFCFSFFSILMVFKALFALRIALTDWMEVSSRKNAEILTNGSPPSS